MSRRLTASGWSARRVWAGCRSSACWPGCWSPTAPLSCWAPWSPQSRWPSAWTPSWMWLGAGIGGVVGERWHSELTRWAAVGRGGLDYDLDDRERASQAQERQPEHDMEGDRPAENR